MPWMGLGTEGEARWTNGLYEAICILVCFPLIVAMGAGSSVTGSKSSAINKSPIKREESDAHIGSSEREVTRPLVKFLGANIMWTATWALNTLIGLSKHEDWMVHMIGHSVGAWTHAPHGYCLAAVSMAYYRRAMKPGLAKFVRFAKNVWNIDGSGMTDEQIAEAGLEALKNWMLEIGLPLTISELMEQREQSQTGLNSAESRQKKTEGQIGATPDMIPGITEGTICYPAGYMDLKPEDITEILTESM